MMFEYTNAMVIIIGGGVSGMACAHVLAEQSIPYRLISPQLGGRVVTSADGQINYGAYVLANNHRYLASFVRRGRPLRLFRLDFHKLHKEYTFKKALVNHELELLRFMKIIHKFQKHYTQFQQRELEMLQPEALESDPYLFELYRTSAETFIKKEHIVNLVHDYISEVTYMCTFTPLAQLNAFNLLQVAMYVNIPVHEFTLNIELLTGPIKAAIVTNTVSAVDVAQHRIKTIDSKHYRYSKLVIALPLEQTQQFFTIHHDRLPAAAHMFHVRGTAKPAWSNADLELFADDSDTIFISKQSNGTYLFYSKTATPQFKDYFIEYTILTHHHWQPAFQIGGHQLIPMRVAADVYLAGDANIVGLEDAYISGVSAAKAVMRDLRSRPTW
jgi:predicted NAD/FAD-dependent oxidoreductase